MLLHTQNHSLPTRSAPAMPSDQGFLIATPPLSDFHAWLCRIALPNSQKQSLCTREAYRPTVSLVHPDAPVDRSDQVASLVRSGVSGDRCTRPLGTCRGAVIRSRHE